MAPDSRTDISLSSSDHGQTMTEYAVVLGVITLLIVGAIASLSGGIINAVTRVTGLV